MIIKMTKDFNTFLTVTKSDIVKNKKIFIKEKFQINTLTLMDVKSIEIMLQIIIIEKKILKMSDEA